MCPLWPRGYTQSSCVLEKAFAVLLWDGFSEHSSMRLSFLFLFCPSLSVLLVHVLVSLPESVEPVSTIKHGINDVQCDRSHLSEGWFVRMSRS